ncbi:MAG TPA: hypothetical protein VMO00_01505 [Methylomirabilota bacterium]|nr:hypothetical protein [Methylomirabilota bacterium]
MAEKRKFAALADLHRHLAEPEAAELATAVAPEVKAPTTEEGRGRGRPATGKRSNPEWKLYSHFLKKQTQRAAAARLQAEDNGRDLSDVLQELLEGWLKA